MTLVNPLNAPFLQAHDDSVPPLDRTRATRKDGMWSCQATFRWMWRRKHNRYAMGTRQGISTSLVSFSKHAPLAKQPRGWWMVVCLYPNWRA